MIILNTGEVEAAYQRTLTYFKAPGAIKSSLHLFKSGKSDPYFFDIDYLINDSVSCEAAVLLFVHLIQNVARQHRVDFLAFIEKPTGGQKPSGGSVGAIRLAAAISIYSGIPNVTVRIAKHLASEKVKLQYDLNKPQDEQLAGANVIVVTDHCSKGRELISAIEAIEENGGRVTDAVAYTIREDLAPWKELDQKGVEFHFFHRLNEYHPKAEDAPLNLS
jgi:orotate phosphoribosyltransferase